MVSLFRRIIPSRRFETPPFGIVNESLDNKKTPPEARFLKLILEQKVSIIVVKIGPILGPAAAFWLLHFGLTRAVRILVRLVAAHLFLLGRRLFVRRRKAT